MPLSGSQIKLRYETSNGVEGNLSVRTNPYTESGEEEVSEDLFYQLVATLAPIHRQVKPSERKKPKIFRERCNKTAYLSYFEPADLDSYLLEEPKQFQNGQRCWFLRFNQSDENKAHRLVLKKISEFIAKHTEKKDPKQELTCLFKDCDNERELKNDFCSFHEQECEECGQQGADERNNGSFLCHKCAQMKKSKKRKAEKELEQERYKKKMKELGIEPVEWKEEDMVTLNSYGEFQSSSIPINEIEAIAAEVVQKIEEREGEETDAFTDLAIRHAMAKAVNEAVEQFKKQRRIV